MTSRGVDALRAASVIAAEDTRVARRLLHALGVDAAGKRVISCHEHNQDQR